MPDWMRKALDTGLLLAVASMIFAAGQFYNHVQEIDRHLQRIENHLNSVDDYAHGRRAKQ